jgi:hypothetical protein
MQTLLKNTLSVSVIIPTNYSRPEMLKEAVASVESQTLKPNLIIEGRKGDWTGENNMYEKLNKAVSEMKTDSFIVLCDDDKLAPTFVEQTVNKMMETKADLVGTKLQNFGDDEGVHQQAHVPYVTALITKDIWQRAGGYDPAAGMAADWDFYWSCKEQGAKIEYVYEPLFLRREHGGQVSKIGNWRESYHYIRNKHGGQNP